MDIKHLEGSLRGCWVSGGTAVKTRKNNGKQGRDMDFLCAGVNDIDTLSL